jgi:predicted PurR-regulated permease PerM
VISRRGIEQTIGVAILALLVLGCFAVLRPFLAAIVWAVILSYSTWPLYQSLTRRLGGRDTLSAALMILVVACVLVTPVVVLSWSMADDIARLTGTVHGWFETGLPAPPAWVATIPVLGTRLSLRWQELTQAGAHFPEAVAPQLATLRSLLLGIGTGTAHALFELLISLLIAFFLYCNGAAAGEVLASLGERLIGERGRRLISVFAVTIRSVVDGLLGANLLQAILGALGFWLAGVPGAVLLGFFLFFLTVVPFGAALVWMPAVLWLADRGSPTNALLLGAWCVLVFPVLENVVRPILVKRGSPLPGLLVLLGMLGGLSAFGVLGVFLGPALLALAYTLIAEWHAAAEAPVETSRL